MRLNLRTWTHSETTDSGLRIQNSDQNPDSELRTQDSELKTQSSGLRSRSRSRLQTQIQTQTRDSASAHRSGPRSGPEFSSRPAGSKMGNSAGHSASKLTKAEKSRILQTPQDGECRRQSLLSLPNSAHFPRNRAALRSIKAATPSLASCDSKHCIRSRSASS